MNTISAILSLNEDFSSSHINFSDLLLILDPEMPFWVNQYDEEPIRFNNSGEVGGFELSFLKVNYITLDGSGELTFELGN